MKEMPDLGKREKNRDFACLVENLSIEKVCIASNAIERKMKSKEKIGRITLHMGFVRGVTKTNCLVMKRVVQNVGRKRPHAFSKTEMKKNIICITKNGRRQSTRDEKKMEFAQDVARERLTTDIILVAYADKKIGTGGEAKAIRYPEAKE